MEQHNYKDFIFVRHGQTDWNHDDILKGSFDMCLNKEGCIQANQVYTNILKYMKIENPIIYSSPLLRAFETSNIFCKNISSSISISITVIDELKERYYGDSRVNFKDIESLDSFQSKIKIALNKIFDNIIPLDRTIIIFSHQKVFEYITELLVGKSSRLEFCGICHFKLIDGCYTISLFI
jgi:bisphosphoglycerate-dependent phosphoglycerate mutase